MSVVGIINVKTN